MYDVKRWILMSKDPVHVGTGGYRLGRVDNSIVREPGTRIPKIPGTSLHGAARSYAARLYETPQAAGQTHDIADADKNPICHTFGYINQNQSPTSETTAFSGRVNIFDAQIIFFPVHSLHGPVWVTTIDRLGLAGISVPNAPTTWDTEQVLTTIRNQPKINLGWLMLNTVGPQITLDPQEPFEGFNPIAERIVIVKPALFSQIINSNLEVRTSVSIDPETGAASSGALFTYEAIPRGTYFLMEVVIDDYDPAKTADVFGDGFTTTKEKRPLSGGPWHGPEDVVKSGLSLIGHLGVGGMGTRGFGRVALIANAPAMKDGETK